MTKPITVTRNTRPTILKARSRHDEAAISFGKLVRDRRKQMGLSVGKACHAAGISGGGWKALEAGKARSFLVWFKAAEVLGLELFWEVEEK